MATTKTPARARRTPAHEGAFAFAIEGLRADFRLFGESLLSFRSEVHGRFADVDRQFQEVRGDVAEIRADIVEMRSDIVEIRADIVEMRADITDMRGDIALLKDAALTHTHQLKRHGEELKRQGEAIDELRVLVQSKVDRNEVTEMLRQGLGARS